DATIAGRRRAPRDVLRRVPLVALGVLVEPAKVSLGRAVVVLEHRRHRARNRPRLHGNLQEKPMSFVEYRAVPIIRSPPGSVNGLRSGPGRGRWTSWGRTYRWRAGSRWRRREAASSAAAPFRSSSRISGSGRRRRWLAARRGSSVRRGGARAF